MVYRSGFSLVRGGYSQPKEHNLALMLQTFSSFSRNVLSLTVPVKINLGFCGTIAAIHLTFLVIAIGYGLCGLGCLSVTLARNYPTSLTVKNSGGIQS
jgi:hypothetical protein